MGKQHKSPFLMNCFILSVTSWCKAKSVQNIWDLDSRIYCTWRKRYKSTSFVCPRLVSCSCARASYVHSTGTDMFYVLLSLSLPTTGTDCFILYSLSLPTTGRDMFYALLSLYIYSFEYHVVVFGCLMLHLEMFCLQILHCNYHSQLAANFCLCRKSWMDLWL